MAPPDELLLAEAREAQAAQVHAQAQADLARVRFRQALRRLHQSGASTREIARAFKLSHQRVHQLVDCRDWPCSFCATPQDSGATFIAGPGVKICHACVARATAGDPPFRPVSLNREKGPPESKCSFCGKRRSQVEAMAEDGAHRICAECLALCREIIVAKCAD
ncbi:MAG: ClpX C4-type zinc finger protein [Acidimicrobiales bacterium]